MLTVLITTFSDNDECSATILSALETTKRRDFEILVVDDGSRPPFSLTRLYHKSSLRIISTQQRIGVGPARYLGVLSASNPFVLIIDSHCRFTEGWLDAITARVGRDNVVHCGSCLGLGYNRKNVLNMDVNNPNAVYFGATWNFLGPDRNNPRKLQVFDNIWAPEQPGDDYELSAVMGAAYVFPREWYLKLHCGRHLTSYGCDEQELSLKTWLAGGECRMLKGLRIGHKFKQASKTRQSISKPYNASVYEIRNKLFLLHTCIFDNTTNTLASAIPRGRDLTIAESMLKSDWASVECERAYNRSIFTRDIRWLAERFKLNLP